MADMDPQQRPGDGRCPSNSIQQILAADGDSPPADLVRESYRFLGEYDIPTERYTSQAFFDLEMERMWPRVWQWACREEHIPEVGDYVVYDIGHYSIIVVRSKSGIKAYHNSCLHRGTKLRPSATDGYAEELRCPFHGWTWSLEGELVRIPCQWDLPHVQPEAYRLPEVRVGLWGGFVFINMDEQAPSLETYLEVLPAHAARSDLAARTVAVHVQKELHCNWKVASEAFLEAYHVQETHPQIMVSNGDECAQYDIFGPHVNRIICANGVTSPHLEKAVSEQQRADAMLAGDARNQVVVPEGSTARQAMAQFFRDMLGITDPADATTTELLDTHGYLVFPNGHFFLGQTFPIAYRIRPIGNDPDRSLFEFLVLRATPKGEEPAPPAEPIRVPFEQSCTTIPGISQSFATIMDQDTSITHWQQEGFRASKRGKVTLTNYQEVRIRHAHRTLDAYLATPPDQPVDMTELY